MEKKENQIVIDGNGLLLGRLASEVAKLALLGNKVLIINSDKVFATGSDKMLLERFKPTRRIGKPFHGPFNPRMPDRIVKRCIRGMLPFHKARGREAYRRVICLVGIPEEFKSVESITIPSALAESRLRNGTGMTVGKIASLIGKYNN